MHRYANFAVYPANSTLIVAVLEDHTDDTPSTVVNSLCVIDTATQHVYPLASGADFYASPAFSPDGQRFAWRQWFHPDMPWEGAEIHCADVQIEDGTLKLANLIHVAGKRGAISVFYPSWLSNRTLLFTSDESGYQNPWVYSTGWAEPVFHQPIAQDFGDPTTVLGDSPYALLDKAGRMVIFTATKDGRSVLYVADLNSRSVPQEVDCPYVVIRNIRQASPGHSEVVFMGMKTNEPATVVLCQISFSGTTTAKFTTLKSTVSNSTLVSKFPLDIIPIPQPMSLQDPPNNEPLHVIFYPPINPKYAGNPEEKPPCILHVHGGPTGMVTQGLDWSKIFYTSRGWVW